MFAISISILSSMCSLPSGTSEARVGGNRERIMSRHPWTSYDVMDQVMMDAARDAANGSFLSEQSVAAQDSGA